MTSTWLIFAGCDANRYSNGCGKTCDGKCKLQQCDVFNGSCIYGCADPNALTIDCLGKKPFLKNKGVDRSSGSKQNWNDWLKWLRS